MSVPRKDAGFSLIEILVSVFVFAIIGSISVALLSSTLNSQDVNETALERVAALDRLRTILREDMGQIALREVRTEDGAGAAMLFAGDMNGVLPQQADETVVLAFTRRGRANPGLARPRSSLLHVEYLRRGDALIRRAGDYPDAGPATAFSETVLLANASDIEIDYLSGSSWVRRAMIAAGSPGAGLPQALRLRYTLPRLGAMEHIVLTSGAS